MMPRALHPLNAVLLAGTVPLFLGVLLSDMAYFQTHEIQWKNFSSWLLVGGLFFGGFAFLWALIGYVRTRPGTPLGIVYLLLLLAIGVLGFIDALVHAGDAWASMPGGLILSTILAVLALVTTLLGLYGAHAGAMK